jgi:hypothetical protein
MDSNKVIGLPIGSTKNLHDLRRYNNLRNVKMQYYFSFLGKLFGSIA